MTRCARLPWPSLPRWVGVAAVLALLTSAPPGATASAMWQLDSVTPVTAQGPQYPPASRCIYSLILTPPSRIDYRGEPDLSGPWPLYVNADKASMTVARTGTGTWINQNGFQGELNVRGSGRCCVDLEVLNASLEPFAAQSGPVDLGDLSFVASDGTVGEINSGSVTTNPDGERIREASHVLGPWIRAGPPPAIPEPELYSMLLAGLGALLFRPRRRLESAHPRRGAIAPSLRERARCS